tara:strand:+ start:104 stop:511 length:408 start_codon:yes stop_codon:yes gene_type:complete
MGRYYNGDIEGKFWFAVQSSNDADFFGQQGQARFLDYYFETKDLPKIEEGIKKCKDYLGSLLEALDEFFEENNGYNNEMLVNHLNSLYTCEGLPSEKFTEQGVRHYLEWYARLELGNQILACVKEKGQCNFEAEL